MSVRLTREYGHYVIDVPIGECVEVEGGSGIVLVTPKVVREDLQNCNDCVLNSALGCSDFACTAYQRVDDNDVIFIEKKY